VRSAPVAAIDEGQRAATATWFLASVGTNLAARRRCAGGRERLLTAIQASIKRTDELHAQHVAELEKSIAGLQEVLRDLAGAAMRLTEINAPTDPTGTAAIEDVVRRARKVMEYLEPPRH
jgi:hypothetical protein